MRKQIPPASATLGVGMARIVERSVERLGAETLHSNPLESI
jgi:hypothetical protein